jgi:hypothetical protein
MKYFLNFVLSFVIVFLIIIGAISFKKSHLYQSFREKLDNFYQYIAQFIEVKKHNLSMELSPPRKPPLTLIEKETQLRMFLPNFFGRFDREEWENFWALIYEPIEETQGAFKVKRYRTKEEIEDYLAYYYPQPFSYFRKQHWDYFWNIVLGK